MPKYIIERTVPGAGKTSAADLRAIAQKSCDVLRAMGPDIQWQHSYVTGDKIYCVYIAPGESDGSRARAARRVPGRCRDGREPDHRSGDGRSVSSSPPGRGSLVWRGKDRQKFKRISWGNFTDLMNDLAYRRGR